jgi:hypothetical protein
VGEGERRSPRAAPPINHAWEIAVDVRSFAPLLLSLLVLAPLACVTVDSPGLEKTDLLDRRRDGALAVFLNRKVTDSIDVPTGDFVDWKYVDVGQPGQIQMAIAFDSPDQVEGEVIFRDTFGKVLEKQRLTAARGLYAFSPVNAVRGRYYIEISADSGASVYTVGVLFEEPDLGKFFTESRDKDRPRNGGGGGGGGGGKARFAAPQDPEQPEADPEQPPTDPASNPAATGDPKLTPIPDPEPEPEPETITVTGSIQRLTPLDAGGTTMAVRVDAAYIDKLPAGTTGVVNGLGATVSVRNRVGNVVICFSKLDPEQLQPYKAVTFKLKK